MHDGNCDENLNDSHHALLFCQASFRDWVQANFREDNLGRIVLSRINKT